MPTKLLGLSLALIALAGCGQRNTTNDPPAPTAEGSKIPAPGNEVQAPDVYQAKFETSKGDFVIEVHREWAPRGADRFYNLVKYGFFDDVRFFRAIEGFMVQFGIHGDPQVMDKWRDANIQDDPVVQSNKRGFITFATSGPDSRSTQVFINFADNSNLDSMGFAPFGKVIEGMDVVDSLHTGYGEGAPQGRGPDQGRIQYEGNEYLKRDFPKLDYVKKATIVEPEGDEPGDASKSETPATGDETPDAPANEDAADSASTPGGPQLTPPANAPEQP